MQFEQNNFLFNMKLQQLLNRVYYISNLFGDQ